MMSNASGGRWRSLVAGILVIVAAISAPLAIVATWAHDEISDTDTYVDTVGPLASEPAIQDAVADRVTHEIVSRIDLSRATGGRFESLVGSSQASLERFVESQVESIVRSDAFARAWVDANRAAHTRVVAVLTGEGTSDIEISSGVVRLNLAEVVDSVRQRLVDRGFTVAQQIPEIDASIPIFASSDIDRAQEAFERLESAARLLPAVCGVAVIGAVAIARRRRRTVLTTALAITFAMVILAIVLRVVRAQYLGALPSTVSPDVAEIVFDAVVAYLRTTLRVVGLTGLVVALVAFLMASSGAGGAVRTAPVRWIRGRAGRRA